MGENEHAGRLISAKVARYAARYRKRGSTAVLAIAAVTFVPNTTVAAVKRMCDGRSYCRIRECSPAD